ncbi:hypothetical protein FOA43_000886 [Brettanomyces nanus]|uniref:RRM domain-containing protein n=1 Tax=Eeniella nana TaxID=13502 RepID=A0A875S2K3_EENNA|nr:uncharacterized protein FOA43_000886 [Brettanomyces nanus]QPG73574.1 hypothetical protein FOA43_000886 [Brettanomyces nanus]
MDSHNHKDASEISGSSRGLGEIERSQDSRGGVSRYGRRDRDVIGPRGPSSFANHRRSGYERSRYEHRSGRARRRYHSDGVPPGTALLSELRPKDSLWDKVAKGYQKIDAEVARQSGLFPSPTSEATRFDDPEKEKAFIRGKLEEYHSARASKLKLLAHNSINSRRLILSGVDFDEFSQEKLQKILQGFLASTVIPEIEANDYDLRTRRAGDFMVIEATKSVVATALLVLSDDDSLAEMNHKSFHLQRPNEYIASDLFLPSYSADVGESIVETSHLLCLRKLPEGVDREQIQQLLCKYGQLDSLVVLLDKITYESKGSAFFSYKLTKLPGKELLAKLNEESIDSNKLECFKPCVNEKYGYYQSIVLDSVTLLDYSLHQNKKISVHGESKVLKFFNCMSLAELLNEVECKFIEDTFRKRCEVYGTVKQFRLMKPQNGFSRGLYEMKPEFGKFYVEFDTLKEAIECATKLSGSKFRGRVAYGTYYDEDDFKKGIL